VTTQWVMPTTDNIDVWMVLLTDTTSRDGFAQNSREYYISFLRNLHDAHAGGLLFALYEGQVIAAGIWVYYHGVAIYYYGASTSD
jgi:lipid II:glycine glycyltransferase (peptidoglycan interpeptide bridge formation enzyme)